MIFCDQIMKEFNSYPHSVTKVAELLAEGRSVCVVLGDHESVITTWDDDDILAIAKKVELEPRKDGNLAYLGWEAGGTVDQPVVAGTIIVTTRKANVELYSAFTDEELHDWLVWAGEHGTSFLQAIAEAAFVSDLRDYYSLRPTLLKLRRTYPENS
jgi:hypothetical protein